MPNEMRERLVELLANSGCAADADTFAELADHLIENGVIVPPCKVGDTVYIPWVWNGIKGVGFCEVTHIVIDGLHSYIKMNLQTDDEDFYNAYGGGRFEFDDFGKTVFLSREEAEQAIKKLLRSGHFSTAKGSSEKRHGTEHL